MKLIYEIKDIEKFFYCAPLCQLTFLKAQTNMLSNDNSKNMYNMKETTGNNTIL